MFKFKTFLIIFVLITGSYQSYSVAQSDELYDWIASGSYVEYWVSFVRLDKVEEISIKNEILSLSGSELTFRRSYSDGFSAEEKMDAYHPGDPFYYTKAHLKLLKANKLETSLYKFTYLGEEEITVPAGKFYVYKASFIGPNLEPGGNGWGTTWIEKNTGLVIKQIGYHPDEYAEAYNFRYFEFELLRSNILEPSDGGEIISTALDGAHKAHTINQIKDTIEETHSPRYNIDVTPPQTVPLTNPISPFTFTVGAVTVGAIGYGLKIVIGAKFTFLGSSLHLAKNGVVVYNFTKLHASDNEEMEFFIGVFEYVEEGDYDIVLRVDNEPPEGASMDLVFMELTEKEEDTNGSIPGFPISSISIALIFSIVLLYHKRAHQ